MSRRTMNAYTVGRGASFTAFLGALLLVFAQFVGGSARGDAASRADESAPTDSSAHPVKYVATRAHVDSPKAFWDEKTGSFVLNSEVGGKLRPIENTVTWVGKGWNNFGDSNYVYTVGNEDGEDFLGSKGTHLYRAPAVPGATNTPVWAGFGADAGIPIEKFRDGAFTLDLVDFSGPGKMEMFNPGVIGMDRMLSSHDVGHRSTWLTAGTHTHNETTFTKPGRYHLTYRVHARGTDNVLISSAPQVLEWQVGGAEPLTNPDAVAEDFAAAPERSDTAARMTLSLQPHRPGAEAADGDDLLTDIDVTSSNKPASGRVIIYIDGYYLTEIPMEAGKAHWEEMIGDESANFQAVFIPDSAADGARWVSAPLAYQRERARQETEQSSDKLPVPGPGNVPAFNPGSLAAADEQITVRYEHTGEDTGRLTLVQPKNGVVARVYGGVYDSPASAYPEGLIDAVLSPAHPSVELSTWDWEHKYFKVTVMPHPISGLGSATVTGEDFDPTASLNLPATLPVLSASDASTSEPTDGPTSEPTGGPSVSPTGEPTTEPTAAPTVSPVPEPTSTPTVLPTGEPTGEPSAPPTDAPSSSPTVKPTDTPSPTPVVLSEGHVDIRAVGESSPRILIGDDTRQIDKHSVVRDPSSVTLEVSRSSKTTRSRGLSDQKYDFLGPIGSSFYLIGQSQRPGLIWPGFSTETLDYSQLPGGLDIEVTASETPNNGRVFFFLSDPLSGNVDLLLDSGDAKLSRLHTVQPTHMHGNWVFTQPGVYRLAVRAVTERGEGPVSIVTFDVAPTDLPSALPSENPTSEPTIQPTTAPSVEPTVTPTTAPTNEPTSEPTVSPTHEPSVEPTVTPTSGPSGQPTAEPSVSPTTEPTSEPTVSPTSEPIERPTAEPTAETTGHPADRPTDTTDSERTPDATAGHPATAIRPDDRRGGEKPFPVNVGHAQAPRAAGVLQLTGARTVRAAVVLVVLLVGGAAITAAAYRRRRME